MIVIMRQKALRARRRDIGVDLRLEIELDLQPARERRDRADITFEPVEDDREARREIIAQRDHVDRAIDEAIGLKNLFLLTLDPPHPGGIEIERPPCRDGVRIFVLIYVIAFTVNKIKLQLTHR